MCAAQDGWQVADAAPHSSGRLPAAAHLHRPGWSSRLFPLLLALDLLPDQRFAVGYFRDEVPPRPEVLPGELALAVLVDFVALKDARGRTSQFNQAFRAGTLMPLRMGIHPIACNTQRSCKRLRHGVVHV